MPVSHPLLKRQPKRAGPAVTLLPKVPDLQLGLGRVHEVCGNARHRFAMWVGAQTAGPILWIAPSWHASQLMPCAVREVLDPARLLFVHTKRAEDVLWSVEESLRAGAISLVIADLPGLPNLTEVRRMHLAAEQGGEISGHMPLGLLLTPGMGGAQGVETRWHLASDHSPGHQQWRLERLRARMAPPRTWTLQRAQKHAPPCRSDHRPAARKGRVKHTRIRQSPKTTRICRKTHDTAHPTGA